LLACQWLSPSGAGAGGAQIALRFMAMSISMYSGAYSFIAFR
jgi:hypothetical protein